MDRSKIERLGRLMAEHAILKEEYKKHSSVSDVDRKRTVAHFAQVGPSTFYHLPWDLWIELNRKFEAWTEQAVQAWRDGEFCIYGETDPKLGKIWQEYANTTPFDPGFIDVGEGEREIFSDEWVFLARLLFHPSAYVLRKGIRYIEVYEEWAVIGYAREGYEIVYQPAKERC